MVKFGRVQGRRVQKEEKKQKLIPFMGLTDELCFGYLGCHWQYLSPFLLSDFLGKESVE